MATCDSASGEVISHTLCFDRYWQMKEKFPTGECVDSPSFKVGDYFWRISYCPNGACSSFSDHIAIFIVLDGGVVTAPVKARARFCLLDRHGEPVPGHSVYTDVREYSSLGAGFGFDEFVLKEFLEASEHLVDGGFAIRCDVCVDRPAAPLYYRFGFRRRDVHRSQAPRSPAFVAEILGGDVTTGDFIRVDGMSAQVFEAFLHFMYEDSLPEMNEQEEPVMAEHLLVAADRFEMQGHKLICEETLIGYIDENTAARMLELSVQHRCQLLNEACIEFLENHPALDAVMATDDGLVEHVAKSCPALLKDLCADWLEDDESFQDDLE
ncbi:hypothetical protein EJB05_56644, partial [Eragrostis curvula]